MLDIPTFSFPDPKRRRGDQDGGGCNPVQIRIGLGNYPGASCRPASPGLHDYLN